jgi:hypothetical protein
MSDPFTGDILDQELEALFDTPYTFDPPLSPLPPEMRPQWRLPVLLILLKKCWGHRASWRQLHVLNWAVRNPSSQRVLLDVLAGRLAPDQALVRFEPGLGRAIDLARGAGLVDWEGGRVIRLTAAGEQAAAAVEATEALTDERAFLAQIQGSVTQRLIDNLIEGNTR